MASAGQGEAVSVIECHGRGEERDSHTTTSQPESLLGKKSDFLRLHQLCLPRNREFRLGARAFNVKILGEQIEF